MKPDIYWVAGVPFGRLAIMPRPRAGDWLEDEIAGWNDAGINAVVSLLEAGEVAELGLAGEADLCRRHAIEFITFPIPDRGIPGSKKQTSEIADGLAERLRRGKSVAIHCRAGIGRSSLIAACALSVLGVSPESAFHAIGEARGVNVPDTDQQREWVRTVFVR